MKVPLPHLNSSDVTNLCHATVMSISIQGGPVKVRPTCIFDGNILMHRLNSINFGKCCNSNSGTHHGKHKSLIFNIVRQMAAPRLGIFALVIFLILFTRTYSHWPIILRFQEVNKILW